MSDVWRWGGQDVDIRGGKIIFISNKRADTYILLLVPEKHLFTVEWFCALKLTSLKNAGVLELSEQKKLYDVTVVRCHAH